MNTIVLNDSVPDESADIGKSLSDQFGCSFSLIPPVIIAAFLVASLFKVLT